MAAIGESILQIKGAIDTSLLNNSAPDSVPNDSLALIVAAPFRQKRTRRRDQTVEDEEGREEVAGQDPLEALGWDLMMKILGFIDAHSVALSLAVSHGWHGIASSDRLWSPMCKELWIGKAHIPRCSLVPGLSKVDIYARAMLDSSRDRIRREDLCDHAWAFHFAKDAPEFWKERDPYWKGTGPPMRRHFHPDGSHSADHDDVVWGGHECCYTVVTGVLHDGSIREHYVRVNKWPELCISRRTDWGWEMSSPMSAYSSIPDADKEGGTGPLLESI